MGTPLFILKSTHNSAIAERELAYRDLLFMHQERINDLKAQIEDLKKLVFIPKYEPTHNDHEVDAVISGSDKPPEISEEEQSKLLEINREADLLVSGNYDEDLLQ